MCVKRVCASEAKRKVPLIKSKSLKSLSPSVSLRHTHSLAHSNRHSLTHGRETLPVARMLRSKDGEKSKIRLGRLIKSRDAGLR